MEFKYEEKMIPAKIGIRSIIGVFGDPPYGHANYFSFFDTPGFKKNELCLGPRAVNMWAENLEHWVKVTGNSEIKVRIYEDHFAFIVDERLPEGYITNCCYTGFRLPSAKLYKHLLELNGESLDDKYCGCETEDQIPQFYQILQKREEISLEQIPQIFDEDYIKLITKNKSLDDLLCEIFEDFGKYEAIRVYKRCNYCKKEQLKGTRLRLPYPFKNWTTVEKVGITVVNPNAIDNISVKGDDR